VIEARHGTAVQADSTRGGDQVGTLQRTVAKRRGLGKSLLSFAFEPALDGRIMRKQRGQMFKEAGVIADDRHHRCAHGLLDIARAERFLQLRPGLHAAHEHDSRRGTVDRRRSPFHMFVDLPQLLIADGPGEPAILAAGIAKDGIDEVMVRHVLAFS